MMQWAILACVLILGACALAGAYLFGRVHQAYNARGYRLLDRWRDMADEYEDHR